MTSPRRFAYELAAQQNGVHGVLDGHHLHIDNGGIRPRAKADAAAGGGRSPLE